MMYSKKCHQRGETKSPRKTTYPRAVRRECEEHIADTAWWTDEGGHNTETQHFVFNVYKTNADAHKDVTPAPSMIGVNYAKNRDELPRANPQHTVTLSRTDPRNNPNQPRNSATRTSHPLRSTPNHTQNDICTRANYQVTRCHAEKPVIGPHKNKRNPATPARPGDRRAPNHPNLAP